MWDTIFKAGTHTDSRGRIVTFTVGDLHRIANSAGDIPLVAHHPANLAQAKTFGKVRKLRVLGDKLQAQYESVPAELLNLVRAGLTLSKSVSIDPITMQLMHVGLLGYNQPPAIEGLGPVCFSFNESEDDFSLDYRIFSYV